MELLSEFELVQSLGFYVWAPMDTKRVKDFASVEAADMLAGLRDPADADAPENQPPQLVASIATPQKFLMDAPPQYFFNKFPNNPGYLVPLYVALLRGLRLGDIDFVLGGSALEVLGSHAIDRSGDQGSACTRYLCQKVRDTVIMCKSKEYEANHADFGHQFERMVTGRAPGMQDDGSMHENLTLARVGGFAVLFCAEADAVANEAGKRICVECKSGNPKYFGTKVMWQMVSSNSRLLVQGEKRFMRQSGAQTLLAVQKRSIANVMAEHDPAEIQRMQQNIVACLAELKHSTTVNETTPTELDFGGGGAMVLKPCMVRGIDMLPPKAVVEDMLKRVER